MLGSKLHKIESECEDIKLKIKEIENGYKEVCAFFAEVAPEKSDEFFSTLLKFSKNFEAAREKLKRMEEAAARQARMDAMKAK
jgi:hypothetical protein